MHLENQQSLKEVLRDMVDTMKWKEKLNETRIRQIWSEKMGTTINHYTHEMNLKKDKLFIAITSASLKHELSYDREKIKTMMNRELGEDIVKEVIIR
jgi:predicted nucleic acid-binding Zn ribbon protein